MAEPRQETYFNRFPNFQPNPNSSLNNEFQRLAISQDWGKKSSKYKQERSAFLHAEFETHLGSIERERKLGPWQGLCRELRVDAVPDSITQCKKVLAKEVHVNIVDLINSRRQNKRVRTFTTRKQLVDYTRKTGKVFPLDRAKANVLLKILLRQILG